MNWPPIEWRVTFSLYSFMWCYIDVHVLLVYCRNLVHLFFCSGFVYGRIPHPSLVLFNHCFWTLCRRCMRVTFSLCSFMWYYLDVHVSLVYCRNLVHLFFCSGFVYVGRIPHHSLVLLNPYQWIFCFWFFFFLLSIFVSICRIIFFWLNINTCISTIYMLVGTSN